MQLSETQFVKLLAGKARQHSRGVPARSRLVRGIGDDCAVITSRPAQDLLITTDLFLEDVHFRREWQQPRSVGHKMLARGLSDIAAMGGVPLYVYLSLGLRKGFETAWAEEFFEGFFALARSSKVVLAGGDTGRSKTGFVGDIMVMGEVPHGKAVLRSGARPGDEIWVTGILGRAARGLAYLESNARSARIGASRVKRERSAPSLQAVEDAALEAFFFPVPRLRIAQYLRQHQLVTAMMDISDGLSIDLSRLISESGVAARIFEAQIPHDQAAQLAHYLHGGEDLELLFTVPPAQSRELPKQIGGVKLTRIGEIVSTKRQKSSARLLLVSDGQETPLPVRGFQHF